MRFPSAAEQRAIAGHLMTADSLDRGARTADRQEAGNQAGHDAAAPDRPDPASGFSDPWSDTLLGDHVSYVSGWRSRAAQLDNESPVGTCTTATSIPVSSATLEPIRIHAASSRCLLGSASRLQAGDVVFADASEDSDGVGKSVEVDCGAASPCVLDSHDCCTVRPDSACDGFKAYLQFNRISSARLCLRLAAGTKVLATTRSLHLKRDSCRLPEVDEQRAIAAVLDDVRRRDRGAASAA